MGNILAFLAFRWTQTQANPLAVGFILYLRSTVNYELIIN